MLSCVEEYRGSSLPIAWIDIKILRLYNFIYVFALCYGASADHETCMNFRSYLLISSRMRIATGMQQYNCLLNSLAHMVIIGENGPYGELLHILRECCTMHIRETVFSQLSRRLSKLWRVKSSSRSQDSNLYLPCNSKDERVAETAPCTSPAVLCLSPACAR